MSKSRVIALSAGSTSVAWADGVRLRPIAVVHIAILLLVISNLGRIPALELGERQAPILVNDLALGVVVVVGALTATAARSLRLDQVALNALLFASIGGISALAAGPRFGLSAFEIVASLAYLARWLLYFGLYLVVINHARSNDTRGLFRSLETAILVFAAFGVIQSIFLPNFALMVYPDQVGQWDAQRHRLVSTVLDPNIASGMLAIVLLVHLGQLASGARVAIWKPLLLLGAMVLTLSRSGVAALFVGGLVVLFSCGRLSRRFLRLTALALVGLVASLPKLIPFAADYAKLGISDDSAAARLVTWERALTTLWENPWFGIGFNTYGFVQERRGFERVSGVSYSAEGGLLFVAVMTGLVGLAVFVAMLVVVWRRCRAGWRHAAATAEDRGLCIGTAAATTAILVHSLFVNSLMVPFVMLPLWLLWGLVYLTRDRMRREGAGGS